MDGSKLADPRRPTPYPRNDRMPAPLRITDTTFRDAHQSLLATRLRIEDMEPIAARMDSLGLYSAEVWGGATFDTTTRFLAEDPWERLRTFKRLMPNTPLMMLLRGQSLVGYRSYADDVVEAFVGHSAETGIDVFRVFDALNDERNLSAAAGAVKKAGKHLQMTICYSVSHGTRMGGPIFNLDYYVNRARVMAGMDADSICVKDMAGLLSPYDAHDLIAALKTATGLPVQLHTHYTSGMASMTALKAIEAGVDIVDTCLAPLALRTSQPAIEPLIISLRGTDRDPDLDLETILEMGDYLESVLPKYRQHMDTTRAAVIDAKVLSHQIPGGMISNLVSQLREADALDRLDEVLEEIPRTRKDLGYPPLVTPMSQMVGTQAVSNVLFGRYELVSGQIKDYFYGLYGRAVADADPNVAKAALEGYERGGSPISVRPGDLIEPEMESAREAVKELSTDLDDVLTYAIYPTTGMRFLRIKHGLDPVPDEMKPPTGETATGPQAPQPSVTPLAEAPPMSSRARAFNVYLDGNAYRVEVDPVAVAARGATRPAASASGQQSSKAPAAGEATVAAPMPGLVSRYPVEVGQQVKAGDSVVVIESMKMENSLPSPVAGTISELPSNPGATVAKGDVLVVITPDEPPERG